MRIGIDWGGTKIESVVLDEQGTEVLRSRVSTPRGDYDGCLTAIAALVHDAEVKTGPAQTVGVGIPGSVDRAPVRPRVRARPG